MARFRFPGDPQIAVSFLIRSRRHGNQRVLIDRDDVLLVAEYCWHLILPRDSTAFYVQAHTSRHRDIYLHRLVMNAPSGMRVDHRNGSGLDNRKANLRFCSNQQNAWNTSLRRNNASGYTGVWWAARERPWAAGYTHNSKTIHLGYFDSAEDAARARHAATAPLRGAWTRSGHA